MAKVPSPRRVEREMSKLDRLHAELGDQFDLNSVESETQALELIDDYAEAILGAEAVAALAAERARRLKARAATWRAIVVRIIEHKLPPETASLQRPLATVGLGYSQKVELIDEALIPEQYFNLVVDKRAIEKALHENPDAVPGTILGNLAPYLIIRPMKPGKDQETEETSDE